MKHLIGSGVGFSTWIVTGKPMHWEGGKIVSMSIYIGTVFLIDDVWYDMVGGHCWFNGGG